MTGPLIKQRAAYHRAMSVVLEVKPSAENLSSGEAWYEGADWACEAIKDALKKEFQQ